MTEPRTWRDLLRWAVSLFFPVFARDDEFMGRGKLRWAVHAPVLCLTCLGLFLLGTRGALHEGPLSARQLVVNWWPLFLFGILYLTSWLGPWLATELRRAPATWAYAALERRWAEVLAELAGQAAPVPGPLPIFLVLGEPEGGYVGFLEAAGGKYGPGRDRYSGDCPLHGYHGGAENAHAIFLCWGDAPCDSGARTRPVGNGLAGSGRKEKADAFKYFCSLLNATMKGRAPINGVLAFVRRDRNATLVKNGVGHGGLWAVELGIVRDLLQVQCPCWFGFDLGGKADVSRLVREDRKLHPDGPAGAPQLFWGCEAAVKREAGTGEARESISRTVQELFQASLPTRIHQYVGLEGEQGWEADRRLLQIALDWHGWWGCFRDAFPGAALILRQEGAGVGEGTDYPVGCCLAACDGPDNQVSVQRMVQRMYFFRNNVLWSKKAFDRLTAQRRWAAVGCAFVALATVGLIMFAWYVWK